MEGIMSIQTKRRTLVTTAAALPALSVPAFAVTRDDPIFAAIEAHRAAYRAWCDANRVAGEAEEGGGYPERPPIILGHYEERDSEFSKNPDGTVTIKYKKTGQTLPIEARYPHDVRRNVPSKLSDAEKETWIAEKIAELEKSDAAFDAELSKTAAGQLREAEEAACDRAHDALETFVTTTPTTLAGVMAALRYSEGAVADDGECLTKEDFRQFAMTLEMALRRMA